MNVFYYDKTFDGLLTVIFDAYKLKLFPDLLLTEQDVTPLLVDQTYTSVTQTEKSARVWHALEKKLSRPALNQLMYVWQSETEESSMLLFRYIRKVIDTPHSIETNFTDDDVMAILKLAKKVGKEVALLLGFVRFQKASNGIYFAPIAPVYNILPLMIKHFTDRLADQHWVLYDEKRGYGYYYDLNNVHEMVLDNEDVINDGRLNHELMAEDEKAFQILWQRYISALTIKERANLRQQKQFMPKRYWHYMVELKK